MSLSTLTLVFLPGIGADHRLFRYQTEAFPHSYAADWIDPLPDESLERYAVRFAKVIRVELDKYPDSPVVVCGLSLGGMIAPYIARELDAAGCILLASIRKPDEFPRRYYLDWLLLRYCPALRSVRLFIARLFARLFLCFPRLVQCFIDIHIIRAFVETPIFRFSGLGRMMFDWAYRRRLPEETNVVVFDKPTLHIHGTSDWLLSAYLTNPDIRIESAGHLPVLTHPEQVNEVIARFCDDLP